MYRDPAPSPPKREGEAPSLEELAAKGSQARRQNDWSDKKEDEKQQERRLQAARDQATDEARRKENAFLAGIAPLTRFVFIAGIALLVLGPFIPLSSLWESCKVESRLAPGDLAWSVYVGLAVFALGLAMFLGGRARRRRILRREKARFASFPYPVDGIFAVFGVDWRPTPTGDTPPLDTHPFGKVTLTIKLSREGGFETRLADALAAVCPGTLEMLAADRLRITSPAFVGGSDAYAWVALVLDRFVPALHEAHGVEAIHL